MTPTRARLAVRPAALLMPAGRSAPAPSVTALRRIFHTPRPQSKLTVGAPDDAFEHEADQVADQVMRMPEPNVASAPPQVQRMCADRDDEMHAKEEPGRTPEVPGAFAQRFAALHGGGQPLPAAERAFFEPRFGRDFANVRLHSGPAAGVLARSVQARAFTLGGSVVFGAGQYAPGTLAGRQLLAHELTHVVQQGAGGNQVVRRQTVHASCSAQDAILRGAWGEGRRMAEDTAKSLNTLLDLRAQGRDPETIALPVVQRIRRAFGDDALDNLSDLSRRFQQIVDGFAAGRTLRCDPSSVPGDHTECDLFGAFVMEGNRTDIFVCPSFLEPDRTATSRGEILLHEMAHSVLGIGHQRGARASFDCNVALGLRYDEAKRNAYPYGILANCLHGEGTVAEEVTVAPPADAKAPVHAGAGSRWSISAAAGAGVSGKAQRFAAALSGRLSLRPGELAVFNPQVGLNLLDLPSSDANPSHLLAATADLGLRIQQPLKGFYFDVSAGGFAGFDIDPRRESPAQITGGLTGAVGAGWRWKNVELGAEARALVPDAQLDRTQVLVFGRAAWRFR